MKNGLMKLLSIIESWWTDLPKPWMNFYGILCSFIIGLSFEVLSVIISINFEIAWSIFLEWAVVSLFLYCVIILTTKMRCQARQLKKVSKELESLSLTDPLTGLYNRGYLNRMIPNLEARARRYPELPIYVAVVDINNLKEINDNHGHDVGDEAILTTAEKLRESLRKDDTPCRYGGDEFVCILNANRSNSLDACIQRLRINTNFILSIENNNTIATLEVSSSIGVAIIEKSFVEAFKKADAMMYLEKEKWPKNKKRQLSIIKTQGGVKLPHNPRKTAQVYS